MTDPNPPPPDADDSTNHDQQRIPVEKLLWAHRRLCRRVASTIIAAMAETDVGFTLMATRLGVDEKVCRRWINKLIDGTATDLREMSDMACAMEFMWEVSVRPLSDPTPTDGLDRALSEQELHNMAEKIHSATIDAKNLPEGWKIDRLSTMPDGVTQSVRLVCEIAGSTIAAVTSYDEDADRALAKACNEARRVTIPTGASP